MIRTARGQVHWIKADWLDEPEQAWADMGTWWAAASQPDLPPVQVEPPDTRSVWSPPST